MRVISVFSHYLYKYHIFNFNFQLFLLFKIVQKIVEAFNIGYLVACWKFYNLLSSEKFIHIPLQKGRFINTHNNFISFQFHFKIKILKNCKPVFKKLVWYVFGHLHEHPHILKK